MKEKGWMYFGTGLIALAASLAASFEALDRNQIAVSGLALACLQAAELFFRLLKKSHGIEYLVMAVTVFAALWFGGENLLPFLAVKIIDICEIAAKGKYVMLLSAIAILLIMLVVFPPHMLVVLTCIVTLSTYGFIFLLDRLALVHRLSEERSEELEIIRIKLENQRRMLQTTEHAVRLAERNRIAGRIHDKIGHGVSGSILLVEAAGLLLDTDGEKAKETLEQAAENLRSSVDEIRAELREERAGRNEAGLAEITASLARFESVHQAVSTRLKTDGNMESISPAIWNCIHESLQEAQTNLLKHSNANIFSVLIAVKNKLVTVEISDNGKVQHSFQPGTGIQYMEERCAVYGGRCFASSGSEGFRIRMTFPQKNI